VSETDLDSALKTDSVMVPVLGVAEEAVNLTDHTDNCKNLHSSYKFLHKNYNLTAGFPDSFLKELKLDLETEKEMGSDLVMVTGSFLHYLDCDILDNYTYRHSTDKSPLPHGTRYLDFPCSSSPRNRNMNHYLYIHRQKNPNNDCSHNQNLDIDTNPNLVGPSQNHLYLERSSCQTGFCNHSYFHSNSFQTGRTSATNSLKKNCFRNHKNCN
jgi:hypothetical protein